MDVGCGDGRVLLAAASKYNCECIGIECDESLVKKAQEAIARTPGERGTAASISIVHGDGMETSWKDIVGRDPTAIFCYLKPEGLRAVRPLLRRAVLAGARLVTHMFSVKGWEPVKTKPCGVVSVRLYDSTSLPAGEADGAAGSAAARAIAGTNEALEGAGLATAGASGGADASKGKSRPGHAPESASKSAYHATEETPAGSMVPESSALEASGKAAQAPDPAAPSAAGAT